MTKKIFAELLYLNTRRFLKVTLIFTFMIAKNVPAQKEFSKWYFGNGAGINFSGNQPLALTDGQLYTEEGCASLADANGNMLFYTNGINIWDKNHKLLPNGAGLSGGISSTQSALILPFPGVNHKYYVFTVAEKAGAEGLSYSVVDLLAGADKKMFTKNQNILLTPDVIFSAARPEVVQKNIRLISPVSEKLTAVRHSNGKDYWIIVHLWNSDAFYAFPVNDKGIGKPVISKIGVVHKETGAGYNRESIGCLVASPDGKKICSAICYKPGNEVELFDFDNSSGKVENRKAIPTAGFAYGSAFSPDNSKLYISFLKGEHGVIQYDLSGKAGQPDNFSSTVIAGNKIENIIFGALQIGPDNKIYIAKTGEYLDIIHKPNEKGAACGYEDDGFFLNGKYSVYGLPAPVLTPAEPVKETKVAKVTDVVIGTEEKKGKPDCIGKKPVITLPADTEIYCSSELVLDAGNEGSLYQWSTKESTRKITVKESGKFTVTVDSKGCVSTASVKVEFFSRPTVFNYLPEFTTSNTLFNNLFQYSINDVKSFEMKIFSGRNKLVFSTSDSKKFWDGKNEKGKPLPEGEYKWVIQYQTVCGNQGIQKKEGVVRLTK